MSLIKCYECGAKISSDAVKCPSCGATNRKVKTMQGVFLIAIALAAIVALIAGLANR